MDASAKRLHQVVLREAVQGDRMSADESMGSPFGHGKSSSILDAVGNRALTRDLF